MEQALYWLAGAIGVPLIQWLKNQLGIEGKAALWLTVGVSVLVAVGALFISDGFEDLTPASVFAVFGQVLSAATLAYKFLMKE